METQIDKMPIDPLPNKAPVPQNPNIETIHTTDRICKGCCHCQNKSTKNYKYNQLILALNEYNLAITKLQKIVNRITNKPINCKIIKQITIEDIKNISEIIDIHRFQIMDINDSLYHLKDKNE
jgi:hypothetical protein